MTRADQLNAFLRHSGHAKAQRIPLAGDASSRRYERLIDSDRSWILMDDPSDTPAPLKAFIRIANHLRALGLSAPNILDADLDHGFLLLEDLGDDVFARKVQQDRTEEDTLYLAAVDVLSPIQSAKRPDNIPQYGPAEMAKATDLAFQWYQHKPNPDLTAAATNAMALLQTLLEQDARPPVLSLRDFHAENLIWLPDREGNARVGLLDFQDAVATHPLYDLVSLTRDARRDVGADLARKCLIRFAENTGQAAEDLEQSAAILAVQRNLRILGIFARLSRLHNKPHYIDLVPRVWGMLQRDLEQPAFTPIREALLPLLPPPDHDLLEHLRTPCPMPS